MKLTPEQRRAARTQFVVFYSTQANPSKPLTWDRFIDVLEERLSADILECNQCGYTFLPCESFKGKCPNC